MAWAALIGPVPGWLVRPKASFVHDGLQLGAAGFELALAFAQGKR
jgi:hypothetical protein